MCRLTYVYSVLRTLNWRLCYKLLHWYYRTSKHHSLGTIEDTHKINWIYKPNVLDVSVY